ncbi:MAG: hypothetical protein M3R55_04165 [Acidobacteriota bacterium]|nr:hypothetical protein [Acidobacteriota bacterium]
MKTKISAIVVLLLIVGIAQAQQNGRQQPPSGPQPPQFVDGFPPPDSFEKLGAAAPIVVRAVVVGSSRLRPWERGGGNPPSVIREHDIQIAEVIKNAEGDGRVQVGAILRVGQEGGALEVNGSEVSVHNGGAASLNEAGEYVLFLKPFAPGGYTVVFGRAGAFRFRGDKVDVPTTVRHMSGLRGPHLSRAEFAALLDSVRKRSR